MWYDSKILILFPLKKPNWLGKKLLFARNEVNLLFTIFLKNLEAGDEIVIGL